MLSFTKLLAITVPVLFAAGAELKTVPSVDVPRYMGDWYQIARNPVFFEDGCVCSRQRLTLKDDGKIAVYNSCNDQTPQGPIKDINGEAVSEDPVSNSKLIVDFGLPFKGRYWIIALDEQYRYAVVSDPNEYSLYILSRTPVLEPSLLEKAKSEAAAQTDISKLQMTLQEGCTYPN